MIAAYLLVVLCLIGVIAVIARLSVTVSALFMDFILIVFYSLLYLTPYVQPHVNGNWIYLVNSVIGLIICGLYWLILITISRYLPKLSKVFHLVITFVGVACAYYLALSFTSVILTMFNPEWAVGTQLSVFQNPLTNQILHYTVVAVISIPVWKKRVALFES